MQGGQVFTTLVVLWLIYIQSITASAETKETIETTKEEEKKTATPAEEPAEDNKQTDELKPPETEGESVSTGAVHKLVHGSDSDELPSIELPDTAPLPSQVCVCF